MNYNNKKFTIVSSSKNSELSEKIIFHYKQTGKIITCNYIDTSIQIGNLIGLVDENGSIHLSYHQINTNNQIMTGTCVSTPEILKNGKIRLHEKWQWTSGDFSKGSSILEEV